MVWKPSSKIASHRVREMQIPLTYQCNRLIADTCYIAQYLTTIKTV